MTATVVTTTLSQRDDSEFSVEVTRASSFDGFRVSLRDNGSELLTFFLRDKYGTEDVADALIDAGLTIKRFNEQKQYEEFDDYMEHIAQEDERFEREVFGGTQEVSFG